tara:strand:- start:1777 stop:3483 length:1707 start_codon:yes stop_codon:yes gene_type:complete
MILDSKNNGENIKSIYEDEIDLKPIVHTLNKGKKLITIVSLITFLLTFISIYFSKRQWSGEFEIVLRLMPNFTKLASSKDEGINPISLLSRSDVMQNTQLRILQSPSVLLEVFEFVKTKKINSQNSADLKFKDWKKQLKFEKQKNSLVLKLTYMDDNKSLVNPVLNNISNVYQKYSGKDRKRQIELGKQFFSSQLNLYRKQSSESLDKAQQFANKYNLTILKGDPMSNINENVSLNSTTLNFNINVETERIKAKNEIKIIENQIKSVKSYDEENSDLLYLASGLIPKKDFDVMKQIINLDTKINDAMNTYKKDDKVIKTLLSQKTSLLKTIKEVTLTTLKGMKDEANARLKASERPKGVFIEYRQLLDNAMRDKLTLQKLDNDFRALSIEEARLEDPWELITKPTLFPNPIPRNSIAKSLFAVFLSVIASSCYLLIKKNRKGLICSEHEIRSIVNCEYHENLLKNDKKKWDQTLEFFIKRTFLKSSKNIAFYIVGGNNQLEIKEVLNKIKNLIPEEQYKVCKNITEIFDYSSFVLITSIDVTNKNELKDLNKKIMQLNKSISSCLFLS